MKISPSWIEKTSIAVEKNYGETVKIDPNSLDPNTDVMHF
jgi:hypothetical protein